MASSIIHVALQVGQMGGSEVPRMARKNPIGGGKQRLILCEDDSGARGGLKNQGGARVARQGRPDPSER